MDRMNVVIALLVFIIFWMLFMGRGLSCLTAEEKEQAGTSRAAARLGRKAR